MFKRQLIEFGLNPILGFIIILTAFYTFSIYLFSKIEYANYVYILVALSAIFQYSEIKRNDFLKFIYPKNNYFKIRILENLIIVVPFIIFLCYRVEFYSVLLLIVGSILFSFLNTNKKVTSTIPTPFYRKPFEFIVGFRKLLIGFLFAYFLTAMSLIYQNFNLGIFSLVLIFILCLSFYSEPENEFYVWVHKLKVNGFLFDKIITAILFSTIISLPVTIPLLIFFQTNINAVFGFQALGYCYLLTIILAKYLALSKKNELAARYFISFKLSNATITFSINSFFLYSIQKPT